MVLQAFKEQDGFKTLNHILKVFTEYIRASLPPSSPSPPKPNTSEDIMLERATLGSKKILDLYLVLVNGKTIVEATQSSILGTRNAADRTRSDYFSPSQFLVEIRMAILPVVRQLWESDIIERDVSQISNKLIEIIRTVAVADHEGAAYKRSEKVI